MSTLGHSLCKRTPSKEEMERDSSLVLVNDLKAAGGPLCSYTITFDAIRSQTIIDSLQSMNHACSDWCPQTCGEHRLTDMDRILRFPFEFA